MKIGFLGLGLIGSGAVDSLLRSGHEVTIWNRTTSKVVLLYVCLSILSLVPSMLCSLLLWHQEEHLACKNWVIRCWRGYLSGARCRSFAYGPADATASQNPHHLFHHLNPDWFYLSGTGLLGLYWKRGRSVVVVIHYIFIDTAYIVCRARSMKQYGVHLSVCLSHSPAATVRGRFAAVGPASRKYLSMVARCGHPAA